MSDSALVIGTIYSPGEIKISANDVQEIVIEPVTEYALASEKTLAALWMTPEEDRAWKDL